MIGPIPATPCHDHYQPRHLPHAIVAAGDFGRYTIADLLQGTAVQVSSFETKTEPLPEAELWFWLDAMAAYENAEDSEYYNVTLLEHAPPTAFTTHLNPAFDDPTTVTTTPSSPLPKEHACDIPLGQLC